jgi:hypothetical protein
MKKKNGGSGGDEKRWRTAVAVNGGSKAGGERWKKAVAVNNGKSVAVNYK